MKSCSLVVEKVRQALLCLSLLFAGLVYAPLVHADIGDRLEVTGTSLTLYAGPSAAAARLMSVSQGSQMVEMERQGSWAFVSLKSSGAQGWVRVSEVRKAERKAVRKKTVAKTKKIKKRTAVRAKSKIKMERLAEALVPVLDSPYTTRKVSLNDIGLTKGILFEGARGVHSRTFYFPAPLDSLITHGSFRLMFRASPNLLELANIRIDINDVPYKQVNLPSDGAMHALDVRLPSSAFKGNVVKVTVKSILPVSANRCFDARLSDIFLHVFPESSLSISYEPVDKSIRDAWRMLPQQVTISLSAGQLSKGQFASTLALMALLVDDGKEVKLTRLPEVGDIIVAPKSTVQSYVQQGDLNIANAAMNRSLNTDGNLALIRLANRSVIALLDPYDVQPMYLLGDEWEMLGAGDHYRVFRPDSVHSGLELIGTEGDSGYFALPLSKLGMDVGTKAITTEVVWQTVVNPFTLPMGTRPEFMNLNIVAPVRWEGDPTYELYVFLNDVLVKSARLNDNGLQQHFTINLPVEYQKQFNDIRVVVQHDIVEGNCEGIMPHDYIQVTPDSSLVVKQASVDTPENFSDLSRYFLSGFDTYVESSYLDHPEQILHLMARLAADFPLSIDHARLHFLASGSVLQPDGPFVAVGRFALGDDIDAPVRFDQGRVKITSPNGESYFDVDQLAKITIAQIVKASSNNGLWITPSKADDLSKIKRLDLSGDNVAFIDSYGVVKTLDSSEPTLAQVYYPDVEDWFDVLGKYKFWLMILLWFLLTMVVVYLYRMSRMNKLAREDDDAMYQDSESRMQGSDATDMHEDHTVHSGGDSLDHLDERR